MSKLKNIEPKVKEALVNNPAARKDDFILVMEVYKSYIHLESPIGYILTNHNNWGLPSFASIIRIRRKLQLQDPSLADAETKDKRADAESDFRDYARG